MLINFGATLCLSNALISPSWSILSNAFAQSNSSRNVLVFVLSPAVMTLLILYNASLVLLFFLNQYCVLCNKWSILAFILLCKAAAMSL